MWVEFYSGDLKRLVDEIIAPRYGNIWLVGGAMLCQSFLRPGLVDEIRLSIMSKNGGIVGYGITAVGRC